MTNSTDLDSLLDATLDDLEDLPEFKSFPAGAYRVSVTLEGKSVNDKPGVEMAMKLQEVIELADATDTAPAEGDVSTMLFFLDNEFGRGKLKAAVTPIALALGTTTIREAVEACKDVECVVVLGQRADKKDPDKIYQTLKEVAVV
jgi:hypothetical protein